MNVDLGSGSFFSDQGLPFDVPFRVRGPITASLRKVTLKYQIEPSEFRKWMHFPSNTKNIWSEPVSWNYVDEPAKDQMFRLTVGPLHPNVSYRFFYTILKTPSLNATQREDLRKSIFKSLTNFLQDLSDVNDTRIAELNTELNKKLKVAVGGASLQNADETSFNLNILDVPLRATTDKIIGYNLIIKDNKNAITAYSNLLNFTKSIPWQGIRKKLEDVNSGRIVLSSPAKAVWDAPVTTSIPTFKDLKVKELAFLLANPALEWQGVLTGKLKIDKTTLVPVNEIDIPSLELLRAFFNTLHAGSIASSSGDVFGSLQNDINEILPAFSGVEDAILAIKDAEQKKSELLADFPDVLADKLISLSFVILDKSVPDVVSQATPYIGLDFGFSYTPTYSQLFAYEGVNYYFVPVNKDAPLSSMTGFLNNISKRLSIHMGLTQSLIAADNKNYQPLINNVGSVLIGAGIRFSRIVRLNYGTIFFYEKNPNPLISNKDLKSMYTFSMTFDINIAKALGSVGTRLGR